MQITFRQKWNDPRLRFNDFDGRSLNHDVPVVISSYRED